MCPRWAVPHPTRHVIAGSTVPLKLKIPIIAIADNTSSSADFLSSSLSCSAIRTDSIHRLLPPPMFAPPGITSCTPEQLSRRAAIVLAWLDDVFSAEPDQHPPTPIAPLLPSKKRLPPIAALSPSPKRRSVLASIDSNMQKAPKTPKNKASRPGRANKGLDEAEAAAKSQDDEIPGSPTPRARKDTTEGLVRRSTRTTAGKRTEQQQKAGNGHASQDPLVLPHATTGTGTTRRSPTKKYTAAIQSSTNAAGPMHPASLPPTSDAGSSRRTRSPAKSMADLQFAAKPMLYQGSASKAANPHADIKKLYPVLQKINREKAIVPAMIEAEVAAAATELAPLDDDLDAACIDDMPSDLTHLRLLMQLETLCEIVKNSERAMIENASEAHWNDTVHAPMLKAAINQAGQDDDVWFYNITAARISSAYSAKDMFGGYLQDKLVDYAIVLSDNEIKTKAAQVVAYRAHMSGIDAMSVSSASASVASSASSNGGSPSKRSRKPQVSVNHTTYDPLRVQPIAISIETKKPGVTFNTALTQLSVWVSAHFLRLHELTGVEEPLKDIALPLIHVAGDSWQLFFAVEGDDSIDLYDTMAFNGTKTLLGCYKILKMLRVLRDWAQTRYRDWLLAHLSATMDLAEAAAAGEDQ